jgi:GT2 family glycosyltransferase
MSELNTDRDSLGKLTIFIQCHNRPKYAKYAIESVLNQTNKEFRFIISDNSSNNETQLLMHNEFSTLEYRRRSSTLSSLDHFNLSIAEADTEFLCLFHDDDMMEPDYVEAMLKTINRYPNAVAYSCNATTLDEDVERKGEFFESRKEYEIIDNPHALAGRYFSRFPNGFAPFPAYIYRASVVKKIPLDPNTGGKYSDVTWLLEISKSGSIVWNTKKLIRYRMHASNDSGIELAKDRLRLLGYLKLNRGFVGKSIISDYRFFLYKKICNNLLLCRKYPGKYFRVFNRYMLKYRLMRYFKSNSYAYLFYKFGKLFG